MRDITKDFDIWMSQGYTRCTKCQKMRRPGTYFAWVVSGAEMYNDDYLEVVGATKQSSSRSGWCSDCVNEIPDDKVAERVKYLGVVALAIGAIILSVLVYLG